MADDHADLAIRELQYRASYWHRNQFDGSSGKGPDRDPEFLGLGKWPLSAGIHLHFSDSGIKTTNGLSGTDIG